MPQAFSIRRTAEDDWERVRALRLENAADNPISFGATLEYTRRMTENDWRFRAKRGQESNATSIAAVEDRTDRWIGIMSAQIGDADGPEPVLTGVYVSPDFRGRHHGVADALLESILDWASGTGDMLRLYVYEHAAPAQCFYARHDFNPTGRTRDARLLGASQTEEAKRLVELSRELRLERMPRTDRSS